MRHCSPGAGLASGEQGRLLLFECVDEASGSPFGGFSGAYRVKPLPAFSIEDVFNATCTSEQITDLSR